MFATRFLAVPARLLLAALALCLGAAGAAIWGALQTPWLGVAFTVAEPGGAIMAAGRSDAPAQQLGPDAARLALARPDGQGRVEIEAQDLIEEPDFFDEFADMNRFFARQSALRSLLDGPVQASWLDADGSVREATWTPQARPLPSLPLTFWFQLVVSCTGCLIACWVWALRPGDLGAAMFALTGIAFPAFALPAAVYSSRELALDGGLFRVLSAMNHGGAFLFGCALLAVFLSYPRRLVPAWTLALLPLFYGALWAADALQWVPDQNWSRLGILSEMVGAMVLAGVQWRASRGRPLDRAALRWLALSMLVGSGLFVFSTIGSKVLGFFPPIAQGYAFGYFLIIYIGLAFGLRRYRLFDLDRWAYRILLWMAGALAVVLMDVALIVWMRWNPAFSLGVSLLVCGWLYFPFRQWLWRRLTGSREARVESTLPELIRIAFSASRGEQEQRWDALLASLFDPVETRRADGAAPGDAAACLMESGQALWVPACGGMAGRTLRLADRGRRLFAPRDAELADSLASLMHKSSEGRDSYERGVREERHRIAQDMHDDIGARLLMLIHHASRAGDGVAADVARAAMGDLRTTLSALEGRSLPLADALADWRAEMAARCEAAGVAFEWQGTLSARGWTDTQPAIPARMKATLERALREGLSNALKHGRPERVSVQVLAGEQGLDIVMLDDRLAGDPGQAAVVPDGTAGVGLGLTGMKRRLAEYRGSVVLERTGSGCRLHLSLPLAGAPVGVPALEGGA
ncbi:sensory histidine kinase UhpB [Pigmentiphaga humi]|uniref:Sensory histidine kinase UhpB n=1 Tax=Pigmentiphaga humi TaxID=2478468 RepID=A0A3P4AX91_9BURK|nr:ATP-binding protein [Pigmentiphaga humi]VCU68141.1 sensory histidine kinase UhpB [Pigmentiphaga humi]